MEANISETAAEDLPPAAFAQARNWGYGGLLAFTAVLLLRPQDTIRIPKSLHIAELCAIVGLAPMLLYRLGRRQAMFRITPELMGLLAFGAVMLATVPTSVWPGGAFSTFTDAYIKILLVFVLMVNTLTTPRRLEQLTWIIVLCVGYVAARGLIDYGRGLSLVEDGRLSGPIGGLFGNPNDLSLNLVTFLPIAIIIAMSPRHSTLRRVIASAVAAMMLVATVLTKSRGGAIGLAVMFVALLILGRRIRPGFVATTVMVALLTTPFMPSSFWGRMYAMFDEQQDEAHYSGSRKTRRLLIEEGIDTFVTHPLTGVGAGQFHNYNPPGRQQPWMETHNTPIQVAAETGVFGLLVFTFVIVRAITAAASTLRMLRYPRDRTASDPLRAAFSAADRAALSEHSAAMLVALAGWFTCAMFASVAYGWTFYYVLALIVAARELTRDRRKAVLRAVVAAGPRRRRQAPDDLRANRGHAASQTS